LILPSCLVMLSGFSSVGMISAWLRANQMVVQRTLNMATANMNMVGSIPVVFIVSGSGRRSWGQRMFPAYG
jgi:hypothetical protein